MTVSIRSGRYIAAVIELADGERRQSPWYPDPAGYGTLLNWIQDRPDPRPGRLLYFLRADYRQPNKPRCSTCALVNAKDEQWQMPPGRSGKFKGEP